VSRRHRQFKRSSRTVEEAVERAEAGADRSEHHQSISRLAALLGRDRGTIAAWIDKGCPVASRGTTGESTLLDPAAVVAWREAAVAHDAGVFADDLAVGRLQLVAAKGDAGGGGTGGSTGATSRLAAPAWSAATPYVVGDLVTHFSNVWLCNADHTERVPSLYDYRWHLLTLGSAAGAQSLQQPGTSNLYHAPSDAVQQQMLLNVIEVLKAKVTALESA
jgi:hypothetical protein